MQNYSELVKIFMVMCSFNWNIGLLPFVSIVLEKEALLWRFQVKLFRIDQDIYGNV